MKIAVGSVILYAAMVVWLTGAWGLASLFAFAGLVVLGLAQMIITFLPRYHAHILMKIAEAELKIEELNREQVS